MGIFLFPFFILQWVERSIPGKQTNSREQLYWKLDRLLRRIRTREQAISQLTQLLEQHGYRLSRQTETMVIFRPKSIFSRKSPIRINISRYPNIHQRFEALRIYAESVIGLLTIIAKADGNISKIEANFITQTINRFMITGRQQEIGSDKLSALRKHLVKVHKESKKNAQTAASYAMLLSSASLQTKKRILQQLVKIAALDGFSSYKERFIFDTGLAMGVDTRYIQQLIGKKSQQKYRQENRRKYTYTSKKAVYIPEYYRILECTPDDDDAVIKKKYRAMVRKYHPDFTESQTTDTISKAQLLQKMQEINLAYEKIKKERNL